MAAFFFITPMEIFNLGFVLIVTDSEGCSSNATLNNNISISCPADFDQDLRLV